MRMKTTALVFALLAPQARAAGPPAAEAPAALQARIKDAVDAGLKFLRTKQDPEGSYGKYPGLTSMAVEAFARSPRGYREDDGPFVRRAVEYLLKLQKADGSIYQPNLPAYNTALALLALQAVGNAKHGEAIAKAQRFLVGLQADEGEGYTNKDKFFGGIGYGTDERPDLSNLQFAVEALRESGWADKKVYDNAVVFLTRCQNRSESNDQPWAGDDGGFVYAPNESKAGSFASYGSMTYAGLKSLMYCNVPKTDPRVTDAWKWLRANWDLSGHPGMGKVGLFYYYQTMSKALAAWGEPIIVDSRGRKHDWYAELATKLLSVQLPDGSWKNDEPRYWEDNPVLVTSRAVLALSYGYAAWSAKNGLK